MVRSKGVDCRNTVICIGFVAMGCSGEAFLIRCRRCKVVFTADLSGKRTEMIAITI